MMQDKSHKIDRYVFGNKIKDKNFLTHLGKLLMIRPKGNAYLDSDRGIEIVKFMFHVEATLLPWRRQDLDTFWIDAQMFIKYGLSKDEILLVMKDQPGHKHFTENKAERDAFNALRRSLDKLRGFNDPNLEGFQHAGEPRKVTVADILEDETL